MSQGPNGLERSPATLGQYAQEERASRYARIKRDLHKALLAGMDMSAASTMPEETLRKEMREAAEVLCRQSPELLTQAEREQLIADILDETFGLGPLQPLLRDPDVTDILVNGIKDVYVERHGRLEQAAVRFTDENHLMQVIQRIVNRVGRRVDETSPMVDARLPDGSRVNAIIRPLAVRGPAMSIRRFGTRPLQAEDLLANGSLTREMLDFLAASVKSRINMVVSGGTGSGKTTLLNILSRFISSDERVVTIEDSAELQLQQPHVVPLETRQRNIEGAGEVTQRDLLRNALRMRPDRIIIGECRGTEALDMLQAMNTGHDGSLTTIHANDTRDAISRIETMIGMAGFDLPLWVMRRQICSAIHLVVQVSRLIGGARKIVKISELTGMEGDVISMQDLFLFKQTGVDTHKRAQGYFCTTGIRPRCLTSLEVAGNPLPVEMFEQRILK